MTALDHPVVQAAAEVVRLDAEDARAIADAWGPARDVDAQETLLRPGDRCRSMWFLETGVARFYAETGASDVTRHFVQAGKVVTVLPAFASGDPSPEGVQMLTAGRVLTISRERAARLEAGCPAWAEFGAQTVREVYAYLDRALDRARQLTAAQRYAAFERDYPDVLLRVPLRYIASYLGMTPQSLSRVRASR